MHAWNINKDATDGRKAKICDISYLAKKEKQRVPASALDNGTSEFVFPWKLSIPLHLASTERHYKLLTRRKELIKSRVSKFQPNIQVPGLWWTDAQMEN